MLLDKLDDSISLHKIAQFKLSLFNLSFLWYVIYFYYLEVLLNTHKLSDEIMP